MVGRLISLYFDGPQLAYNRNKLFKIYIIDPEIFLDKGPRIVSPAYFVYDFSTKLFLMLYSIN